MYIYMYIYIHPYIKLVRVLGHVCRWSLEGELGLRCSTLCPLPLKPAGRRAFVVLHCAPAHSTGMDALN